MYESVITAHCLCGPPYHNNVIIEIKLVFIIEIIIGIFNYHTGIMWVLV